MVFHWKANQVYLIETQAPELNIVYNILQIATALIWSSWTWLIENYSIETVGRCTLTKQLTRLMANLTEYKNSTSSTEVTAWWNAFTTSLAILADLNIFLAITANRTWHSSCSAQNTEKQIVNRICLLGNCLNIRQFLCCFPTKQLCAQTRTNSSYICSTYFFFATNVKTWQTQTAQARQK